MVRGRSGSSNGQGGSGGGNGTGNAGTAARARAAGGQSAGQAQQIPADQWVTIEGSVRQTEQLAVTIALQTGEQVRVVLGQTDIWSAQNIWFAYGDWLKIDGFWQNGQFEAGAVTFSATGQQLAIRDTATGQLLWPANTQGSQGQGQGGNGGNGGGNGNGNGYRGGRQ